MPFPVSLMSTYLEQLARVCVGWEERERPVAVEAVWVAVRPVWCLRFREVRTVVWGLGSEVKGLGLSISVFGVRGQS